MSSRPKSGSSSFGRVQTPPMRPRVNQPSGFRPSGSSYRPTYYYGRRHDYIYYPVAWVDNDSGISYQQGYYDENGNRYDNVAFEKDGRYSNVVCRCSYCGTETVLDLSAKDAANKTLQCPSCGAPMEIQSLLDEEQRASSYSDPSAPGSTAVQKKSGRHTFLLVLLVIFSMIAILSLFSRMRSPYDSSSSGYSQTISGSGYSSVEEDVLFLNHAGNGAYTLSSHSDGSKILTWDSSADSYYDAESDCWLWYNTDVEPPLWQYWYEGISSDFGDYGWMEHEDTGWYIEASNGNWIPLPDGYDTTALWYIAD